MTREEAIQVCTDLQAICLSDRIKDAMRMAIEALKEVLQRDTKPEKEYIGFEEDEIFLLSSEEYEKYRDEIPVINCWWWLRSPGYIPGYAAAVGFGGSLSSGGRSGSDINGAVRPALKLKREYDVGARIVLNGFTWIVIDKSLAIAEAPIWFTAFDADNNNCYRDSYIRAYLKKWLKGRSETSNINEQKKGKWVEKQDEYRYSSGVCSCCGWDAMIDAGNVVGMPFCPNCGAKMQNEENNNASSEY